MDLIVVIGVDCIAVINFFLFFIFFSFFFHFFVPYSKGECLTKDGYSFFPCNLPFVCSSALSIPFNLQ